MDVAGKLGLRRLMVLPFEPKRFRETSVIDRPGDWGALFDRIIEELEATNSVIVLNTSEQPEEAYSAAGRRILDESLNIARAGSTSGLRVLAVVVWDGAPHERGDSSHGFVQEARARDLSVLEVFTNSWKPAPIGVKDKLKKESPRRLLALDGGGIRGLIAVECLARIEEVLRKRADGSSSFVLADYFDYIAGTSTGAIIAAGLALGWSVEKIRRFYLDSGPEMFHPARLLNRIKYKYDDDHLSRTLRDKIGEKVTLGSDALQTLLMIVLRNATTDSPWPVSNNPFAKYNMSDDPGCNLKLPLWRLVRASTAAPIYFPPEVVEVAQRTFVFVDGGLTMYNNPAFQLFLMATVEPYKLRWPAGEEQMLLVSLGTGSAAAANDSLRPSQMNLLYNATSIPAALMSAASHEQDLLCRTFGRCLAGAPLDGEVGDMIDAGGPVKPKLFTYLRYDCDLSRDGLDDLGISPTIRADDVQKLDATDHMDALREIGELSASQVREGHFVGFGR
jgi:hypothetical protein